MFHVLYPDRSVWNCSHLFKDFVGKKDAHLQSLSSPTPTTRDPLEPDQKQFPGLATVNLIKIWERWVLRAPTRLIGYNPHAVGWFHPTSYEQHWYSQVLLADGHYWVIELQPLILHGFYQAAAFRSKPAKQEWHFPAKIPIAEPRASQRRPGPKCPLTW